MATSTSDPFPLATESDIFQGDAGGSTAPGVGTGTEAGASGDSYSAVSISTGGLVAIIVIVVAVAILGASTATLFYIAKKREWTVKETIRRSARKVVTALTPRRTEFPDSVKNFGGSSSSRRFRARIADDVPPTPRLRPEDIEKGLASAEAQSRRHNWAR
ncbi:hypothetical protein S40285_04818 [Stachybotrys chlorohalonatus IBT 40285]|uniref:Uncharacterized protein n=2 Tax=Stachybotrys TaxID=74721 RepID=A0A084QP23_STAC4|nr:hypothetical protein S7711_07999 [Stachybotrys chartarum IBT 7711]KFA52673.1 hypothetical protein S40293_05438 [Stachybotrys chartarum IBT 40293]KFA65708.1 hypothetical protein S40285_04818 [Stachybotrys chlorohalonata IBT 40285]KFA74478.1 hypothetical protein S40288_06446 [Stachybotrys chartarum IBT 40288]